MTVLLFDFSWVLMKPTAEALSEIGQEPGEISQRWRELDQNGQDWRRQLGLNVELIEFVDRQRPKYASYVFSASSPEMLNSLRPQLVPPFVDVFSSGELGVHKYQPDGYRLVAEKIGVEPGQILFADDRQDNVSAARAAGCHGIVFADNAQFMSAFERMVGDKPPST